MPVQVVADGPVLIPKRSQALTGLGLVTVGRLGTRSAAEHIYEPTIFDVHVHGAEREAVVLWPLPYLWVWAWRRRRPGQLKFRWRQ
jgi:hypothetical protein